jgi:3-deoxy-D-manno-octulosonic-acid transferase
VILKPLFNLLAPLIKGLVHRRLSKGLEEKQRLQERYGVSTSDRPPKGTPVIWFHGASVGEVVSLVRVVEAWKARHPDHFILLTTTTVTGAQVVQQRLKNLCTHQYAPFDIPKWIEQFLNFWDPSLVIFVESEVWPNQMQALTDRSIPLVLLNARLSPRSFKRWKKIPKLGQTIFSNITLCLAQDTVTAQYFSTLGARNVQAITNLKFLADPLPVNDHVYGLFAPICANRPVWVAASTHPGEEEIILRCHEKLSAIIPNLLTFLIPRHPKRIKEVEVLVMQSSIAYQRRKTFDGNLPVSVCLVDSLGEMGAFYKLANVVFLGGSLVPIGGHNPIEPALFSKPIIWGPHIYKTLGIAKTFGEALCQVQTESELLSQTQKLLTDANLAQYYGEKALDIVQKQAQQLDVILKILEEYL